MKKLLCVGCSWTYGFGVSADKTYAAHLQNLLNVETINAGCPGTDIEYTIWSTYRLVNEYEFDTVLFQLTTLDRLTFSESGKENFLNKKYHDGAVQEIYIEDGNYKRVIGIGENKLQRITVSTYLESLNKKDEKSLSIKYFNENVIFSNLKQEKISMQLQLLKSFLNGKNINIIFFTWLPWHKEFSKTLDPVDIRKDSVIEFLGEDYFIDNGYHINEHGHRRVAEEYIIPMIAQK
jgi:hypothetical protein